MNASEIPRETYCIVSTGLEEKGNRQFYIVKETLNKCIRPLNEIHITHTQASDEILSLLVGRLAIHLKSPNCIFRLTRTTVLGA